MAATTEQALTPVPQIVARRVEPQRTGWTSWVTTTDHKRIGIMYLVLTFVFFILGGTEALLMRLQLSQANNTLLDPQTAPARELAGLYQARWEIETALGAFKTGMKGAGIVLRSKTPDGAEQEIWALLCAYHAIRELICAAAAFARADPLRISFASALDTVRQPVGNPGAFPP